MQELKLTLAENDNEILGALMEITKCINKMVNEYSKL